MKSRLLLLPWIIILAPIFAVWADSWNVELVSVFDTFASGVHTVGDYSYVACQSGLSIVDVSNPATPQEVGFCNTPDYPLDIYVVEDYVYIAASDAGLRVIDVSDPTNPHEVGFCDTFCDASDSLNLAWGIYVIEDYAYVAAWNAGLRVIDVSNPSNPHEVGFYDTPGNVFGVHVLGSYAYVADRWGGFRVVDISNPEAPNEVGFHQTPDDARAVYVLDNHVYVVARNAGLRVIDVSDPTNPYEIGFCNIAPGKYSIANDICIAGGYAYIADYFNGLRIINVSDPIHPYEVGFFYYENTTNESPRLDYYGGYVYLAYGGGGLSILRYTGVAGVITVDDDLQDFPNADFTKIQDAVNAANPEDTIAVYPGSYTENVDVNKENLTIESVNGADLTIVQVANLTDHAFEVTADNVTIKGFTTNGSTSEEIGGICLNSAHLCSISNNIVLNGYYGIFLIHSLNNNVTGNRISDNYDGILVLNSSDNEITINDISKNGKGILVQGGSSNNKIVNNNISNHSSVSILLHTASNNTIDGNTLLNNYQGIIATSSTSESDIKCNIISNNNAGIWFFGNGPDNRAYLNNFLNNVDNIRGSLTNTWLWHSPEPVTYTYNSTIYTNYLGNYWSGYTGSDANGDGIGDTPYSIDGDTDNYPLMQPFENYLEVGELDGTISGTIIDFSTNEPIEAADVSADGHSMKTVSGGYYELSVPAGTYDVTVSASGYETQIVYGTTVIAGQPTIVDFELDPAYVMVNNTPSGVWRLRHGKNAPDFTKVPLMEVPDGWGLKLIGTHQDNVKAEVDGQTYVWWKVENPGNSELEQVNGWMASKRLDNSGAIVKEYVFLPGSEGYFGRYSDNYEEELEEDDRKGIIVEVLKHYYNEGNSSEPGLYSSTNICTLNDTDFPIELVLAIAAQESGFNKCGPSIEDKFNNEVYGDDGAYHGGPPDPVSGGVGIMQITTKETRGCGSGLKCYAGTGQLAYSALESSLYFDPPYSRCGYTRHQYYTNTIQGIYANIKDALYLIKNNYDQTDYCIGYIHSDGTIITEQEMRAISTVQRYNAGLTGLSGSTKSLLFTIKEENLDGIEDELDTVALNEPGLPALKIAFEGARKLNNTITPLSSDAKVVIRNSTGWRVIDTGITDTDKTYLCIYSILRGSGDVYRRGVPVKYVEDIADKIDKNKNDEEFKDAYDQSFDGHEFPEKMRLIFRNSDFISLGSPAELRVYDSDGHVTGILGGEVIEKIPNSIYNQDSKTAIIFVPSSTYRYEVIGTAKGPYELDAISVNEGVFTIFNAVDIPTSDGAIHRYTIDWDALSQGEEGVTVRIDFEGDNTFDILMITGSSFLSTSATIDFDPDTLNLKSAGKWITCYIELSEGYSVEEIVPNTVRLWVKGSQILAEEKPTAIGDYDADGILDLMLKFSRSAFIEILKSAGLTPGDVTLTVNGQVGNAIFEGTDTVRVVKTTGSLEAPGKPTEFALLQNFSNPFNPDTWIPYQLAEDVDVVLRIYNASGQLVRTLELGHKPAGFYINKHRAAYWDGRNDVGEEAASGIYFYTIKAGDFIATRKMILVR